MCIFVSLTNIKSHIYVSVIMAIVGRWYAFE